MMYRNPFRALALCVGFIHGTVALTHGLVQNRNSIGRTLVARQDATATCLAAQSIATGSFSDGKGPGDGAAANDAPSETDKANFINAGCDGKTLTNGLQNEQGSCNPIPMGDIPSAANMVTTIILSPAPGEDLEPNKDFEIKLRIGSLVAGSFTNPQVTYYSAPQRLDSTGRIIGHVHVTVQELLGSLTPKTPPDPTTSVVHFKGIDNAADANGELTDIVPGLPPGFYRVCSMASASNHQPVIMPVAKRGAQDDCTKITVGQGGGANNGNANGGGANGGGTNGGGANGGGANGGGANGGGAPGGGANGGGANGGGANGAGFNGGTNGGSNSSAQVGARKF